METLPVIPTPPGQKWREFRIKFLPLLVWVGTVASIAYLWREHVMPPTLVAQVEPVVREIRAQHAGFLTNLFIDRFQAVREGEVIAEVITTDPRQIDARVQMLRGQIALVQLELGTLLDRERVAFDYHSLRTEYMRQQTDLQEELAKIPHLEYDVNLARALFDAKIGTEFEYRGFLLQLESAQARAKQLATNVAQLEEQLIVARPLGEFSEDASEKLKIALARLETERDQLETAATAPTVLRAPIAGVVTSVFRRPGEVLAAGEIIASISGVNSDRLVGYIRQPSSIDPKPGMKVQVRTRSWKRLEAEALVTGVGAQFEVITNVALLRPNAPYEVGLPVAFNVPEPLKAALMGGELVEVSFHSPFALFSR